MIVVVVLSIPAISIIVVIGVICVMRRRRGSFTTHIAEVDSNSTCSDNATPQYIDTPDLGRKTNGIELRQMDMIVPAYNGSMLEPSGPIDREDFVVHVEKFDASRQLLFQEEFEVSEFCLVLHVEYFVTWREWAHYELSCMRIGKYIVPTSVL